MTRRSLFKMLPLLGAPVVAETIPARERFEIAATTPLLEVRRFDAEEIARYFDVPVHLVRPCRLDPSVPAHTQAAQT